MPLSVFDIFKIGIGPSSSHTMGPMNAARAFMGELASAGELERTSNVAVQLYGSLALTGVGHCTDRAILLGLGGMDPATIDVDEIEPTLRTIRESGRVRLLGKHEIEFDEPMHLLFHRDQVLPRHPNGMRFTALDAGGAVLRAIEYYSIGGGFILRGDEPAESPAASSTLVPHPFRTAADLLRQADLAGLAIHDVVLANEQALHTRTAIIDGLDRLWEVMQACVRRGFAAEGVLPGALRVRRRAPQLVRQLRERSHDDALLMLDWVSAFAIAVNEENAAGGRVVTAPTNGAAGIVPAVLHYYRDFEPSFAADGVRRFLLCAAAIGMLYKQNASLSGAEMGCQGEVGVACSMAAAGLAAALRGTNAQIENAAEIGMEHNLGLTCDPVAGLVQIPCIERNAMGSVKAINAARLALRGDGTHHVSLDQVIATMRQTGHDMAAIYKETSLGGLAVNVPEC